MRIASLLGWLLIGAAFIAAAAETAVHSVPGIECPTLFATRHRCDHCNTKRKRKDTFIVRKRSSRGLVIAEADGDYEYMQVGRQCIRDFLGVDPSQLAWMASVWGATDSALRGVGDGATGEYQGRYDLERFVVSPEGHTGPIMGSGVTRPFPQDYTMKDFTDLQGAVRLVLEKALLEETYDYRGSTQVQSLEFNLVQPSSGPKYIYVIGSVRDVFLTILFFLLAQEGVDNIKTCPECGTIYYKHVGWQKYCSRRCTNLASVKRFQAKQKKGKKHVKKSQKT